jgi:hypothetical protein
MGMDAIHYARSQSMTQVSFELPTELLELPNQTAATLNALAREALIVRLYD